MERRPRLPCPNRARGRVLGLLAAAVIAAGLLFSASPAYAQNKAVEAAAKALQKKAMDEDYLNVDLDKAAERLNQAMTKCGTDKCSANLRALLRRDLATVYSAANKKDEALATMTDALKIDASIQLDPNFRTKEVDVIFAAAKKGGGGSSAPSSGGGIPSGDFTHTPASEQAVRTPLPIYVEYGGSEAVTKVVVKYKGFGMTEFKTLELKKIGTGWGANIPCADIQQGDFAYYLQGFNANNDPVATGGDRNNPYKTTIAKTISGEAPHLPGQQPAAQCADTGDCPPDFPGCKKTGVVDDNLKGEGDDCEEDNQCKSGTCKSEKCTKPKEEDTGGSTGPKLRRFWLGVGVSLDLQFVPGAKDVCVLNGSSAIPGNTAYECTTPKGADYINRNNGQLENADILIGENDSVNGGLLLSNFRVFASFDYALNYNVLLGARFGYTAMTYPGQAYKEFPPLIIEGRATYVFGNEALMTKGLAPLIFLGGGAGNFSSSVGVDVDECDNPDGSPAGMFIPVSKSHPFGGSTAVMNNNNPGTGMIKKGEACAGSKQTIHSVNAWRVAGPVFVGPGGGLRYAFSDRAALTLDVKLALVFGNAFMFDPTPELVFQYGF